MPDDVVAEGGVVDLGPRCGPVLIADREQDRGRGLCVGPVVLEHVPLDEDAARILQLEEILDAPVGSGVSRVVDLPRERLEEVVVPHDDVRGHEAGNLRVGAPKDEVLPRALELVVHDREGPGAVPARQLVRIRISPAPGFAGSVNQPVYVAPAASRIVSPGCAWSRAACRSPPGGTSIIPVKCGRPVWAAAVAVRITLSAIRNGSGRTNDAGGIIHDTVRPTRIR